MIGTQLENHRIGIFCVTPENMLSPWLLFEAGALSKVHDARVCPLLIGVPGEEIESPLSQFQATVFNREEMFALATSLNQLANDQVEDPRLRLSIRCAMAESREQECGPLLPYPGSLYPVPPWSNNSKTWTARS